MKWGAIECVLVIAIVLVTAQVFHPPVTGSRSYFSPDSLQSKYENDEWLLGLIPYYRAGVKSSPLADYLVEKGYWTPARVATPRWIVTGHYSAQWKDGQSLLHYPLYWQHEKWIAWTEAHPEIARVVWPQLLASLRRDEPQEGGFALLLLAEHAASVDELRQLVRTSESLSDKFKSSLANSLQ
jgi:hypothetical protein